MEKILNDKQIELLMGAVEIGRLKKSHKGYRFLGEGEVYKKFDKELMIINKPICITGVSSDYIRAEDSEFVYEPKVMSSEDYEILSGELSSEDSDDVDKIISSREVSEEQIAVFRDEFNAIFEFYKMEVESMKLISRISGTKLLVKFSNETERYSFSIELPFIDKNLWCKVSGNIYSFAYIPLNLEEYVSGCDDVLLLAHPYQFLLKKALLNSVNKPYSYDLFIGLCKRSRGGLIKAVQANIIKTLRNAKEYSWSEKNNTPIMWVDGNKSELGKFMLENNIQLNFNYDALLKAHGLVGIDLLTGSTGAPGKRCKISKNYFVRKNAGVFELVKKDKSVSDIFDICNVVKSTIYPCFTKTSAKRDNSATIKDTYDLVFPSQYKKRFTIKG